MPAAARTALLSLAAYATVAAAACSGRDRTGPSVGPPVTRDAGDAVGGGPGAGNGPGAAKPNGLDERRPAPAPPLVVDCTHHGKGHAYEVGPGKKYDALGKVPFESLRAGDTVRIFWRPDAYHEKLMISGQGAPDQPIRVCGVAGPDGQLPVIDGDNATTRRGLDFPYDGHQVRGLITIGHRHDDPWERQPAHFVLEGLEVRGALTGAAFTDRDGKPQKYSEVVAGIFVQRADDVTIRGCNVHGNEAGLFIGTAGGIELTRNVLVEGNWVHDNGSPTSFYVHNSYNEVDGIVYQYNWFGSPHADAKGGVQGDNIKDRGAGVVVRYNWIEDGSHLLDLVDTQEAQDSLRDLPRFQTTFVYGNVLVRTGYSGSLVKYGGDSGVVKNYRNGTLFFFDNTVAIWNQPHEDYDSTAVFELSTNDQRLVSFDNVYWSQEPARDIRAVMLLGGHDGTTAGVASFAADWLDGSWFVTTRSESEKVTATATGVDAVKRSSAPGFRDAAAGDYAPAPGSPLIGAGQPLPPEVPAEHHVDHQYVKHQRGAPRDDGGRTIGAFAP